MDKIYRLLRPLPAKSIHLLSVINPHHILSIRKFGVFLTPPAGKRHILRQPCLGRAVLVLGGWG